MSEKVACLDCGALILPVTAKNNEGKCIPCKKGYRKNLEQAKEYYKKERELDKNCPFRALWRNLEEKVYKADEGFNGLSEEEKIYFSVGVLDGETYNGGIQQFFDNSSGDYYSYAELGLVRLEATNSLKILRQAKKHLFGTNPVPKSQKDRWDVIQKYDGNNALDNLDTEYYKDLDNIGEKLDTFALKTGLVKNA